MHTGDRVPLVDKGTPVPLAISTLSRKHFGCVGILDEDERLCGIITEGDLARNLTRNLSELVVDDIMPSATGPASAARSGRRAWRGGEARFNSKNNELTTWVFLFRFGFLF